MRSSIDKPFGGVFLIKGLSLTTVLLSERLGSGLFTIISGLFTVSGGFSILLEESASCTSCTCGEMFSLIEIGEPSGFFSFLTT